MKELKNTEKNSPLKISSEMLNTSTETWQTSYVSESVKWHVDKIGTLLKKVLGYMTPT